MKNEKIYKNTLTIFLSVFLLSLLLSEMAVFSIVLSPLKYVLFPMGVALLVWKFRLFPLSERGAQTPAFVALTIFMLVNLISIFINYETSLLTNLINLSYMGIFIYLGFDAFSRAFVEYRQEFLSKISKWIVSFNFTFTLISLLTFCLGIGYQHKSGFIIGIDINTNRLWGLFNPNAGSTIALISVALSLYLYMDASKRREKIFNVINVAIQLLYIALAQSRATIVATAVFVFIVVTAGVYNKFINSLRETEQYQSRIDNSVLNRIKLEKFILALGLGLIVIASSLIFMKPMKQVLSAVPDFSSKVVSPMDVKKIFGKDEISHFLNNMFIKSDSSERLDLQRAASSKVENSKRGRTMYWKKTLESLNDSPVVGLSYEGLIEKVQESAPDKVVRNQIRYGGVHSTFFSILGASGILGLLAFGIFFVFMNLEIINHIIFDLKYKHVFDMKLIIIYSLVAVIYMIDLMESRMFYSVSYYPLIIWLLSGTLYGTAVTSEYGETVREARTIQFYSEIE